MSAVAIYIKYVCACGLLHFVMYYMHHTSPKYVSNILFSNIHKYIYIYIYILFFYKHKYSYHKYMSLAYIYTKHIYGSIIIYIFSHMM